MFFKRDDFKYFGYRLRERLERLAPNKWKLGFGFDKYFWYRMQERWNRLGVRRWINANPRAVVGIMTVSVVVFFVIIVAQLMPDKGNQSHVLTKSWFYDLNTGELFAAKINKLPPIEAPSGELPDGNLAGVRAYVFCYDDNPDNSEPFVGFLEKLSPEAKARKAVRSDSESYSFEEWADGRFFRRPDGKDWIRAGSAEGLAMYEEFFISTIDKEPPRHCMPE